MKILCVWSPAEKSNYFLMTPKKYSFSGHESFSCKSLWLKKGFDFVANDIDFNAPEAVVALGVGKNMVASIRYWLKVLGLTEQDKPTQIANYLLDKENGKDRYIESLGTLWLLHFLLLLVLWHNPKA